MSRSVHRFEDAAVVPSPDGGRSGRCDTIGHVMFSRSTTVRLAALGSAGVLLSLAATPGLVAAKEKDDHKVTICHVTNSAKNPWVILTVDTHAFDGEGKNDHSHHESKDGRVDILLNSAGECAPEPTDPPTDPSESEPEPSETQTTIPPR